MSDVEGFSHRQGSLTTQEGVKPVAGRELYFQEGIRYLPHLLEMVDRNRLSPTYGCFDRSYWHYRTSDFPSGMFQEDVLPLALAYSLKHPQNPYYHEERLKELVCAGIDFAAKSSHRDGSCDDYFPFERAAGAASFSLYACTEAYLSIPLKSQEFLQFLKKRAHYLAKAGYEEAGTLSNHKALIVLSLYNVFRTTEDEAFKTMAERRLERLLSLQKAEGWFPEYEGCDPGYLMFAIDFLAKYHQNSRDERVVNPLRQAIDFNAHFMHPDGTLGGEYGSRNTFHILPHGLELMAPRSEHAVWMANLFLDGLSKGKRSYLEDDRLFCHYVYNFLQAYNDYHPRSGSPPSRDIGQTDMICDFKEAGLVVRKKEHYYGVFSVKKGGTAKIFQGEELWLSDAGFVGRSQDGKRFTSAVFGDATYHLQQDSLVVEGSCYEYDDPKFTPLTFIGFRLFNACVGRFLPANATRRFLQKRAILKSKKKYPLRFRKTVPLATFSPVEVTFYLESQSEGVQELWLGSDPTFIYGVTSQPYQPGALKPWIDLSGILPTLNKEKQAVFRYPCL